MSIYLLFAIGVQRAALRSRITGIDANVAVFVAAAKAGVLSFFLTVHRVRLLKTMTNSAYRCSRNVAGHYGCDLDC